MKQHVPVLLRETVQALDLRAGDVVVDATLGLGGHAEAILNSIGPSGKLLAFERTEAGLAAARERLERFAPQTVFIEDDFRSLGERAREKGIQSVAAVLFDLGLASWQIDEGLKGLSFQLHNEELDMRLTPTGPGEVGELDDPKQWTEDAALAHSVRTWRFRSAAEFLARAREEEIRLVFRSLGDLTSAEAFAARICAARRQGSLTTVGDVVSAFGTESPKALSLVFQALRILVNDEYGAIVAGLRGAWQLLRPNGVLAVISFHSGEHRLVKREFRALSSGRITTIHPAEEEIHSNPRARSATLRTLRR